jgi:hypothetical protein
MADTYYGYSERLAENQIDWATIGKDLSKALSDEATIRKTKQAALETAIQDATKRISNYETGDSSLGNKRMAELASNTTQYLQTIQRLWKSGQLNTQQLTEFTNNVNTGIDGALELNKDYQAEYKRMKERAESADPATRSQLLEQWEKSEIANYGTLTNTQYYIDPTSGLINLAKIKKETVDGKEVVTMGDEFMTVNDARSRLKNEYNYFDSAKATSDIVDSLGTTVLEIREKGGPSTAGIIRTITDPRYKQDLKDKGDTKSLEAAKLFEDVINRQIEGMASNPLNALSYLTNDVKVDPVTGKAYTFTRNPEEQTSSDVVLLKIDEMGRSYPDFTTEMGKKQYQVFKEKMRNDILIKLDTKEEIATYNEPEPNYGGGGGGDDDKTPKNNLYEDLYSAWDLSKTNSSQSAARLTALAKGEYQFKWVKGGLQAYKLNPKYGVDPKATDQYIAVGTPVTNLDALQTYFYSDRQTYDLEKERANKNKTTTKPKPAVNTSKYN